MISEQIVTETWQGMNEISESNAAILIDQMRREQPIIMMYLLAASEQSFDLEEGQAVFFIGIVIWLIMRKGQPELRKVDEKLLERTIEQNETQLEKLTAEPGADRMMASTALTYAEPEVLRYLVEALMEPDEDLEFSDEERGLAFVILKNALDALIASRKNAN
ncbi:MAG: hypothetical protein KDE54_14480 [Caldilineaceae bacterium]|nr:hypothetical protein [Caldilineaceae bacterium]MCB0138732.1 hypothetical protein [Caldilineaceae bacterium]